MKSIWELEQRQRGGFRKVGELPREAFVRICRHPEHNPPGYIVLEPGVYEYVCPGCGRRRTIVQKESASL